MSVEKIKKEKHIIWLFLTGGDKIKVEYQLEEMEDDYIYKVV